ncbi:MAG: helix-turn-helix domain-containing protein [Pseudonocardia sp.]|nr:helix-turn-helix domain-containing protein [Pseudonocardia sp.]
MPNRSTGGRDALSSGLLAARKATGRTAKDVAERIGYQPSKLSRIENGQQVPTEADVRTLTEEYQTPQAERQRLLNMARDVKAENRRVVSLRDPAAIQQRLGRIERDSNLVREFSPNIIPGLLQAPGYIRAHADRQVGRRGHRASHRGPPGPTGTARPGRRTPPLGHHPH